MTKRILIAAFVLTIVLPFNAFAVQDVVLTAVDIYIEDPGTTLKINGSTVDQIVVNTTNVVITMSANGNSVTVISPSRYQLSVTGISDPGTSCNINDSTLVIPSQGSAIAVTVDPTTVCAVVSAGSAPAVNPVPPPPPPLTSPVTTTGTVTATASQGGDTTIATTEGSKAGLKIPIDAISTNTSFAVSPIGKADASITSAVSAIPAGKEVVGSYVYDYTATVVSSGAKLAKFAKAMTLSFTFTDAQFANISTSLQNLKVHYYDSVTKSWAALSTTVDAATKTFTANTDHFTYFAVFEAVAAAPSEVSLIDNKGAAIADGDLIKTASSFDIYIVKLVGSKKFKRLILNPAIFNSYRHLKWENVKTVSQAVQDAYVLSGLVLEVNEDGSVANPKVFKVSSALNSDVGQKQWLNMTAAQFEAKGYDWDAIYKINHTEASKDFYPEGTAITFQ